MNRYRFSLWLLAMLGLGIASCERASTEQQFVSAPQDYDGMLVLVFDLSGSFSDMLLKDDGRAYKFALAIMDQFFRARIGNHDRVIIAQISGKAAKPMLWGGSPQGFKRDFPNAKAFRDYLASKTSPDSSPVYRGIAESIEYVLSFHERPASHLQSATFVFSDFLDNDPDSDKQKERLLQDLKTYSKYGPAIGFYWIDSSLRGVWEKHLRECGFHGVVETDIITYPELPKFE